MQPEANQVVNHDILEDTIEALLTPPLEPASWTRFVALTHPLALSICARRGLRREVTPGDDLHGDAALRAMELIREREFAALRRFREARVRYPRLAFEAWFATLVTHAHIDVVRGQPSAQRRRADGGRRLEVARHVELDDGARASAMPIELAIELRRVIATIASGRFSADQRRALALWLDGHDAAEIANLMSLASPRAATQLLRAARQRLRRLHLGVK